jgi:hypothetical protein
LLSSDGVEGVPDMTQHAQDQESTGTDAGTAATDQARGIAAEARGAAREVADEARAAGASLRQEVSGLGGTLKQGLTQQVEQQKAGVADRIAALAERAERSADDLRDQEAWLAGLLGRGARELHGVADEIRNNDVAGLLGSVEVFARRQPALFTGAAVALGFALTRVVRGGGAEEAARSSYREDGGSSYGGQQGYGGQRDYGVQQGYGAGTQGGAGFDAPSAGSAYELGSGAARGGAAPSSSPDPVVAGSNI